MDEPVARYFDKQFKVEAAKILPGQYHAAADDIVIVTVLGSCVSACLWDPLRRIGGMNHFMLPGVSRSSDAAPASATLGVYAMEVLINRLLKLGAERGRLQAKVFGGASVLEGMDALNVGTQNGAFIAGISGVTVANGVGVIVNSSGKLGTVVSSARFKDDIKPMGKASDALLKLKPVTFRYKQELDPDGIPQFGLVAEQVEKVNPDLVVRDEDGKVMTVRYEAVNAMLLNEFLKAHRKLDQQQAMIDRQQKQIEALSDTVRRVSDRLEFNRPAPQVVANDQ